MTEFPQAFSEAGFHDSLIACIRHMAAERTPLLALGQTVFWDELLKSMLAAAARQHAPDLRLIAGAHDTDYFSKLTETGRTNGGFSLQPRDDDRTQQMWAAVAETSALLGTEYAVKRADLRAAGVPLRQLARRHPDGLRQFYREVTGAWGWRGVANHSAERTVACDISAHHVSPAVRDLMAWAIERSREVLVDEGCHSAAERMLQVLDNLIERYRLQTEDSTLTDLYLCLLSGFYAVLLGGLPEQVEVTASTDLLLFTCDTIDAPRFDVLDAFLDPSTRTEASAAYDTVVAHSGIYRLEKFGDGAIPFDIVICGRGRGTIRVLGNRAIFDLPEGSIEGVTSGEIIDRQGMLAAIADAFGCDARLVGKAIVLPLMLSREFSMVLLENASTYVPQSHRLVRLLSDAGVELAFNPILRLHFETWDAIGVADAALRLPNHLRPFFPDDCINTNCFSEQWRAAVAGARALIEQLGSARAPEDILAALRESGEDVSDLAREHRRVARRRRDSGREIESLCERTQALWIEIKQMLREADARHEAPPEDGLAALRAERQKLIGKILDLAGSEEHQRLQRRYKEIVLEIRRRKLELLADAHRTVGLEQSNYRPPWWWFLVVDPQGRWLRELAETATMRTEPLGMMV